MTLHHAPQFLLSKSHFAIGHPIQIARAVPSGYRPTIIGQQFKVPADSTLRELEGSAHFGDGKLGSFQKTQQPGSGGVRKALHPENHWG